MSELKPFDEFMDALVHCDTVKVILTGCGESTFETKPIYEGICALANRRAQPAACEIAEYAEDCKDCGFCAQPANEPLTKISEMLEQAAQDMDDKCRQWQCVLQRVHDTGTFDQNSGLWVGIDKEREAKAQANFEAYRYSLGVIDKIAEHVSNPYKSAHKPGGEQE